MHSQLNVNVNLETTMKLRFGNNGYTVKTWYIKSEGNRNVQYTGAGILLDVCVVQHFRQFRDLNENTWLTCTTPEWQARLLFQCVKNLVQCFHERERHIMPKDLILEILHAASDICLLTKLRLCAGKGVKNLPAFQQRGIPTSWHPANFFYQEVCSFVVYVLQCDRCTRWSSDNITQTVCNSLHSCHPHFKNLLEVWCRKTD